MPRRLIRIWLRASARLSCLPAEVSCCMALRFFWRASDVTRCGKGEVSEHTALLQKQIYDKADYEEQTPASENMHLCGILIPKIPVWTANVCLQKLD